MPTAQRKPGRPRGRQPTNPRAQKATPAPEPEDDLIGSSPEAPKDDMAQGLDLGVVYGGVSASWLAHVFGMDKNTVKKKLAQGCTIVGKNKGTPLYTIKEAAQYLVTPKVDLATYVKSLRPNDLPPILNDAYWAAMLKRQKWEENAGDLWRTVDVLEVFGGLSMMLKTTIQLWTDELDRVQGMTDAQRVALTQMTDGLLNNIHEILVTAPKLRNTPSSMVDPADREVDDLV